MGDYFEALTGGYPLRHSAVRKKEPKMTVTSGRRCVEFEQTRPTWRKCSREIGLDSVLTWKASTAPRGGCYSAAVGCH